MKQKIFSQKIKLLIVMAFAMLAGQHVFADNVVGYDLTSHETSTIGQTGTFSVSAGLTLPSFSGDGAQSSGWDTADQYWTISSFNTTGLHTITVGAMMNTDDAGPRDFQLQYKLSGGSWTNVGTVITLTGTLTAYNRTLPNECANVTGLSVRWLNSSSVSGDGGAVTNDASSYIKAISILGSLPTRPNSQFTNITFTSITSTTIKLDGTIGNGSHRIIYIVKKIDGVEAAPTFPDPADDATFIANPDYKTGTPTGYQVIYNGTESSVTVTVPSSTNEYWFRVYEYNLNGTMPRYYTPTATKNPYLCSLPIIVTDPATLIRLTTATIGATISYSKTSVSARGTQIKTGSSLAESTSNKSGAGAGIGSFTRNLTSQARGSRFYFRGYATNECGTIYSDELYYENIPIFSGTGSWEDNTKWNVLQVPGSTGTGGFGNVADSPIINGICTLTADNNVTNLTINASKQLVISKATRMKVDGTLTNNAGTTGILIKSIDDKLDLSANGSLVFANGSPQATVEMFSKASWNISNPEGNRFSWQYFGIPVTTLSYSGTFSNCYVREWDESVTNYFNVWVRRNNDESLQLASGSTLTSGLGYELVQQFNRKYNFAGTLVHSDFNKVLPYTTGARFAGQSILSNPYAAAIDITQLQFGANTEAAVYLYNTGTFKDWENANGEFTNGSGPGTYTVSTPGSVGLDGVPTQIPSMQGFLVKATANPGSISFAYSNLLKNSEKQRVKSTVQKTGTMIDLIGTKYGDRMWILDDANCSAAFDNGYDGRKMIGFSDVSQIYGMGADEIYQIMAVNDLTESYIGIQPGTETNFKLKFTHQNIDFKYSKLYLVDIVGNTTVDITNNGAEYSFIANPTDPVKRFKIVSGTTNNQNLESTQLVVSVLNGQVTLKNQTENSGKAVLFDATGRVLSKLELAGNENVVLPITLSKGLYVVRLSLNENIITRSIIVN